MRTLMALTVGVFLVFGLQAMDSNSAADRAARYDAAKAALQQHDNTGAVRLFGECVALSDTREEHAIALTAYGSALHRVDRNTEAKRALEQALVESNNVPEARAYRVDASDVLASVYRSLGDYPGAERVLRAAIPDPAATSQERAGPVLAAAG